MWVVRRLYAVRCSRASSLRKVLEFAYVMDPVFSTYFIPTSGLNHRQIRERLTSIMSESFDLFCLNAVNQILNLKTKVVSESLDLSFDTAARFLSRWKVLWQFSAGREDFDNTLKVLGNR